MDNIDSIIVIGISHKQLSTEERELFIQQKPRQIIHKLYLEKKINGYVELSTCLRAEYYIDLNNYEVINEIKRLFGNNGGIFVKKGVEAVEYLFKVSCGFYSVIKGEEQILSQVKNAYKLAMEEKITTTILNVLFNKGIDLGKKFRTQSQICKNALSLEAISLKFIKNNSENLEKKKILILGIGELAQSILYLLVKSKVEDITITNRTTHRALELKNTYDVNVIKFDDKLEAISQSDIIISVTSAPHTVLRYEEVTPILKEKEYLFLDLAVPRDVDIRLGELSNVTLYNLDDVWKVYHKHQNKREHLLEEYLFLVEEQIKQIEKWFDYRRKYVEKKDYYRE